MDTCTPSHGGPARDAEITVRNRIPWAIIETRTRRCWWSLEQMKRVTTEYMPEPAFIDWKR
jgi:hypothetical protein